MDGVFADFVAAFLVYLYESTGYRYSHEDVTDWDICKALNLPSTIMREFAESLDHDPEHRTIPQIAGADEGLKMVQAIGDVRFATTPFPWCRTWASGREAWLARQATNAVIHRLHTGKRTPKMRAGSAR